MATGTFPVATETTTTLDVLIPEIWSSKMNDFYRADLRTAAFFTDLSSELAGGGDILHIPNLSEMTAHTKSVATAVTLELLGAFVRLAKYLLDCYNKGISNIIKQYEMLYLQQTTQ